MKIKKILSLILLTAMAGSIYGCNAETSSIDSENSDTTTTASTTSTTSTATESATASSENNTAEIPDDRLPISVNYTATSDAVRENSLVSLGNTYRTGKVLDKIAAGEAVTVGFIGGSITEGLNATADTCYAANVCKILSESFGNDKITCVNAGVSGTPSVIGVARADKDILAAEPDLVFIEFAVNDGGDNIYNVAYESLVRKFLNSENAPAVALIFTVLEAGYTSQPWQSKIGNHYNLPMISVNDSIYKEITDGNMTWQDYSNDGSHPNPEGHIMVGELVTYCLDSIYKNGYNTDYQVPAETIFGNTYENMKFADQSTNPAESLGGFELPNNAVVKAFPSGWIKRKTSENLPLVIKLDSAKDIMLIYRKGKPDTYGDISVKINDNDAVVVAGNAADGWNGPDYKFVYNGDEAKECTIEIKLTDETANGAFYLFGIGYTS